MKRAIEVNALVIEEEYKTIKTTLEYYCPTCDDTYEREIPDYVTRIKCLCRRELILKRDYKNVI
jgi:hypothetical protein